MKLYKKGADTSYTLGVFPTIELLKHRPEIVKRVVVHSKIKDNSGYPLIVDLCNEHHIHIDEHDATIDKLSPKANCLAVGIFKVFNTQLEEGNHIVLDHPMDMGNIGTIMRTALGFGYTNIAIIRPAVNIFDPKAIRASMGALFSLNVVYYDDFESYRHDFPDHHCYPFMLKGATNIHKVEVTYPHALIFGNESSGLDDRYLQYGQSVFIPHYETIDSLNLSISLGIGLFHFSKRDFINKEVLK